MHELVCSQLAWVLRAPFIQQVHTPALQARRNILVAQGTPDNQTNHKKSQVARQIMHGKQHTAFLPVGGSLGLGRRALFGSSVGLELCLLH